MPISPENYMNFIHFPGEIAILGTVVDNSLVVAGGESTCVSVLELSLSSFRALAGRLKFMARRHKFNEDPLSGWA